MPRPREEHPISNVRWVARTSLRANDYNPNHVAPAELRLLRTSLLEDGWTQPIVARPDGEIVDGFHRWTVAQDAAVAPDGMVPVVFLPADLSPEQQRMATIRHNRARGAHGVVKMARIVDELVTTFGVDVGEISERLEMDDEEVERLRDHGAMTKRGAGDDFSEGWGVE